ncbi:Ubiquitin carboxyl-terminal hydrolase isozyme L3 [Mortierella sp. GBA43]|nr:Ubiquitin carboxyl-terminal hydrolase isozyme L3 [Mortierella sp. GBA43]
MSADAQAKPKKSIRWLALESNPEYIRDLGVEPPFRYVDVLGLDEELLGMVPQPVNALILLFPITPGYEKFREEEQEKIDREAGQEAGGKDEAIFYRQTIANACGTMGVLHSLANNWPNNEELKLKPDSIIQKFLERTRNLSPDDRAVVLEEDTAFAKVHENHASTGQTDTPDLQDEVNLHFVCLVHKGGRLYELDGNKKQPIDHGSTNGDSFLVDAAKVAREFVKRDPDNLNFSVIAATTSEDDF